MRLIAVLGLMALAHVTCANPEHAAPPGPGPAVRAYWAITLQEPDSLYLARPSTVMRGLHGETFVSDIEAGRVIVYDNEGRPVRVVGRPGGGPGEFRQASSMFLRDDSTLAVLDLSRGIYQLFDLRTGGFQGKLPFEGVGWSSSNEDSEIWLGAMDLARNTSVAHLRPGADAFEYLIPLPPEYRRTQILAGTYAGAHVVAWQDTLLVGMTGSDVLRIFTTEGAFVDSVRVPVRIRRGVPLDIERQLARPRQGLPEWVQASSMLIGLFRQSDGELVLVHGDYEVVGATYTADLFVTTLAPDWRHACIDTPLPVSHDAPPVLSFRSDTLYVLDRQVVSDTVVDTRITAYGIDGSACQVVSIASVVGVVPRKKGLDLSPLRSNQGLLQTGADLALLSLAWQVPS